MANEIVITLDAVRAAVDISLDANTLPEEIIKLDIYSGTAIAEVKSRDSQFATRTADQLLRLSAAADLICAALLIDAIPDLTEERDGGGNAYRRQIETKETRISNLRARADREIASVISSGSYTSSFPNLFKLGAGRRGA